MIAITKRYLVRLRRTPRLLFFVAAQPVLFVLVLNAVFGGVVEAALRTLGNPAAASGVGFDLPGAGGRYIQFLLPGVLVMNVMLLAGTTALGLAEDLQAGIIDRFRSLPMSRSAVLVGRTSADLVRSALTIAAILIVGFAMGYRLRGSIAAGVGAIILVFLFAYATSWLFALVGLVVKDPEVAQFAGFAPVLPIVFLSGAWIPVETMPDGLQVFARNQPVNVLIEAVRALADGSPADHWVWQSVAWSVGILIVSWPLAARQYRNAAS